MSKNKITVLGAGSWGTTLAILLTQKFDVTIWEFDKAAAEILKSERTNQKFLPGINFPENLSITNDLSEAIKDAVLVTFAVPSFALRSLCESAKNHINKDQVLVSVIKGLEDVTFLRMSQIIDSVIPNKRGVVAL